MQPLLTCRSASSYKISLKSVDQLCPKKRFSRWRLPQSLNLQISIFGHVIIFRFNICYSVPNFIKIERFFTEIWRFNDFQNGGRPQSWILIICNFRHVALVDMPLCFLIQNFAEIEQSVELWSKKIDFQDGGRQHLEF